MKIVNVHVPDMASNYLPFGEISILANKLADSYSKIEDDTISIYMKDDSMVSSHLRLIKEKCEMITKGGGKFHVYEYELGVSDNTGHIFLIDTEEKRYYCTIQSIRNIENGDLHIDFHII